MVKIDTQVEQSTGKEAPVSFEEAYLEQAKADGKFAGDPISLQVLIEQKRDFEEARNRLRPAA